jgi:phosphoribosylaminoimidazolecarboxamide formyltransferase/IMP cyclohydrolase
VAKEGVSYEEAIENIDIGGPSMVRSAAKNHARVLVVTEPSRYDKVLGDLRKHGGSSCFKHRQKMAWWAFATTGGYDNHISLFLAGEMNPDFKRAMQEGDRDVVSLRYGENPHQTGRLQRFSKPPEADVAHARQHHGKQLGYINLLDADAALAVVKEWDQPAACIVKHATPCGVGSGDTAAAAFNQAYEGDPLAAFGGIVALNVPIDCTTAEAITSIDKLLEVIVAPGYDADALELLKGRWKNARLLETGRMFDSDERRRQHRSGGRPDGAMVEDMVTSHRIVGGELIQQRDLVGVVESEWKTVTRRPPTSAELAAIKFNWLVCKHVKSNAVVVGGEHGTYGIGGGQVDRVAAAEHAVKKAGERAMRAVAASDAFFPFPDGPQVLIQAGVTAIVQPGGSVRDQATIDLCDAAGVAMIFTGRRHFRH